jgi:hypothetical protein
LTEKKIAMARTTATAIPQPIKIIFFCFVRFNPAAAEVEEK